MTDGRPSLILSACFFQLNGLLMDCWQGCEFLGEIKLAPAPTLRILEMSSLMLTEKDAFVGVLHRPALSWLFDFGSPSAAPWTELLPSSAKFHPLPGGRWQSSFAYHALWAATVALHPPSSPHCCPVTFAPSHTSLTALQDLLTGCGPAGPLASPDVAGRRTVVQNKDIKSLKTVSSEKLCVAFASCYTLFFISFSRNLKLYSSKQLKLIQMLQVTMAIWVRKFFQFESYWNSA